MLRSCFRSATEYDFLSSCGSLLVFTVFGFHSLQMQKVGMEQSKSNLSHLRSVFWHRAHPVPRSQHLHMHSIVVCRFPEGLCGLQVWSKVCTRY
ncbi:hypothetical protein K440DRAFT_380206 [Wilcoxina mikolae CBS 423.85]|nr:hypothetical protein K440DRAFT_380206 [Wilcoxina mikolae CBS 423.85]